MTEGLTAHRDDVLKRAEHVATPRKRLDWAVAYSQTDIDALSFWDKELLRKELAMFLATATGLRSNDYQVTLPDDEAMAGVSAALRRLVDEAVEGKSVSVGAYQANIDLIPMPRKARGPEDIDRPTELFLIETGRHEMPPDQTARYILAKLLSEHSRHDLRLKRCPAPKRRSSTACGTIFVGTPKKLYCSHSCQTRAATRAVRAKK
jgi:hypothetical protein